MSDPMPGRSVNIYVPHDVAFDIAKMRKVTERVLNKLGCEGCHSGIFLNFRTLEDFVVNSKTLDVEALGAGGMRA